MDIDRQYDWHYLSPNYLESEDGCGGCQYSRMTNALYCTYNEEEYEAVDPYYICQHYKGMEDDY